MSEKRLGQEEALLLELSDVTVGAFSVDANYRIVTWNQTAEELFGYRADEVLGRPCFEVMPVAESGQVLACCRECALVGGIPRGRAQWSFELHVTTPLGEGRWLSFGTVRAKTLAGQTRVLHVFRDVTAYHALDDSLARMRNPVASQPHSGSAESSSQPSSPAPTPSPERANGVTEVLTPRETEALRLLARGMGTREIAEVLGISRITARNHVTKIMEKLGARTRLQAVLVAAQQGLI
jgi:PAS domain S-box-containing protein